MQAQIEIEKLNRQEADIRSKLAAIQQQRDALAIPRPTPKPVWYRCGICFHFSACEGKGELHHGYTTDPPCPKFSQLGRAWQRYPGSVPIAQSKLICGIRYCPICAVEGHHLQGPSNDRYYDCKVTFEDFVDGRWITVGQCGCFAHQHGVRE